MIVNALKSAVQTSEVLDHKVASISLNPVILHVLSKDLYQKNVESPFREVLINALDAHIESCVDRPVEILLPTIWQEQFSIRDFGTGLSHEDFMAIYLDYGNSSRRGSNEVHGGLGLGTKSPLAYTTSFTVTSYHNEDGGTKARIYIVYYNEDNLPCVDLISCIDTTESTGIKVQYTTSSSNDYIQFRQAALNILPRIPKEKYVLLGDQHGIVFKDLELHAEQVLGPITLRAGNGISIIMGFVAYKMELKTVKDFIQAKSLTLNIGGKTVNAVSIVDNITKNNHVEILSSIGEYPVHPSREYVNVTPRAISTFLADLQRGINKLFAEEELDFEQDTFRYRLLGTLPEDKANLKVRARYIRQHESKHYWEKTEVPNQSNNYLDLIHRHSEQTEPIYVAKLIQFDLTDYLGSGRRYYEFPADFPKKTTLLVIDKEYGTDPQILDILNKFPVWDLDAEVAAFRKERDEEALSRSPAVERMRRTRVVVKSIQDPKHNILVYNGLSSGEHKVDWNSATHNIQSLKALKKEVYWVATRVGCVDGVGAAILMRFLEFKDLIPEYKRPVIIGLPASRGTKTVEKAFKPLSELDVWIDAFLKSAYVQRRSFFHSLQVNNVIGYGSNLQTVKAYGPADWLIRFEALCNKYGIQKAPVIRGPNNLLIKARIDDIAVKFPTTRGWGYNGNDILFTAVSTWAEQVAEFTNNKPTGAKSKNAQAVRALKAAERINNQLIGEKSTT
jgi:hypothetical protein